MSSQKNLSMEDPRLFNRLGTSGCKTSIGLVSLFQDTTSRWTLAEEAAQEGRYVCPLNFYPSKQGVGKLVVNGSEIPQKTQNLNTSSKNPTWEISFGKISYPLGKKSDSFRLSKEEGKTRERIASEFPSTGTTRILALKVRGTRGYNRHPKLEVSLGNRLLFQAVVSHAKPHTYLIPFIQSEPSLQLELELKLVEASIPVWEDHSQPTAHIQVDNVEIRDAGKLLVRVPNEDRAWAEKELKKSQSEFLWVEVPSRSFSPAEISFLREPDEEMLNRYLRKRIQENEKLGRVSIPGIRAKKSASFTFPVSFASKSSLTFSIGLTPTYGNYVFVQVVARTQKEGKRSISLLEEVVAQPHLQTEPLWKHFSVPLPPDMMGEGFLDFRLSPSPDTTPLEGDTSSFQENPASYAVLGNPRLVADPQRKISRLPNALLICIDTLRADHLSCYGYSQVTSPNMDRFAKECSVFKNAVSTSSWTLPAHLSLFNGVPLGQHGGPYHNRRIMAEIPTLAGHLQNMGYRTAAFVGGGYVSSDFGMDKGFDYFDETSQDVSKGYPGVASWLEGYGREEPFFLFFHFFDVHSPYGDKAEDVRRFFDATGSWFDEKLVEEIQKGKYASEPNCGRFKIHISDQARQHMIHLYDADIYHVDSYMEKLFVLLRKLDLFEKTTLIITSDHGEEFGEHGNWHHSKHLYREVVNIPLLVKWPKGSRLIGDVDVPVSLLDIPPTLAMLAGGQPPSPWYGKSLVDISSERKKYAQRKLLMENVLRHGQRQVHMMALQDMAMKYFRVYTSPTPYPDGTRGFSGGERQELYMLRFDPHEKVDVSSFYSPLIDRFKSETQAIALRVKKDQAHLIHGEEIKLSDDVLDQLRALGYLK